ncbi:MAG: DUF3618 domain-containing protein [Candidatus Eremiobacteraeota bacterium]|nr:DUF3618 domain-containing protein [Candidatus Eremiobacteraeota bacterium]
MGKETGELRQEIEQTRDRMGDTVDAIAYKTDVPSRMHDALSDRVDSMKSMITGTVGHVRHGIERTGSRVGESLPDAGEVRDAAGTAIHAIRENPLGLLFGGMAAGFLLGSLLPVSDLENERLGPYGRQIKATAQDAGSHILDQGKAVVRETVEAAKHSVQEHGEQVARSVTAGTNSVQ